MREYTASLSYATISSIKMELIAKLVRGKKVEEALTMLAFLPKKGGRVLAKVIKSAYANARQAQGEEVANAASVYKVDIGRGPKIKRMRFASRARVYGYTKHRSFVRVVLSA